MARYVTLIRFTEQGARNIKRSLGRGLAFRKTARCLTQLAALGNVRTETFQALHGREFKTIID